MVFDPSKRFFPNSDRRVDAHSLTSKGVGRVELRIHFMSLEKSAVLGNSESRHFDDLARFGILIKLRIGKLNSPGDALRAQDHRMKFSIEVGIKKMMSLQLHTGLIRFDQKLFIAGCNGIKHIQTLWPWRRKKTGGTHRRRHSGPALTDGHIQHIFQESPAEMTASLL